MKDLLKDSKYPTTELLRGVPAPAAVTREDHYVAAAMQAMISLRVARSALPHEAITLARAVMATLDEPGLELKDEKKA